MIETSVMGLVAIPAGLGLIGFVEPCSIGSTLIFLNYLEGKSKAARISETLLFAATRALFIGVLGALAAGIGSLFIDLQRGAWVLLGFGYVALGAVMATGYARILMTSVGPGLRRFDSMRGSAGLGLLFGLNIPACAAPLLFALLAGAAASGASGVVGFVALGVFGLALSLPLVVAVFVPAAGALFDRFAGYSGRYPVVAGVVLIGLGLWSAGFGLFATLDPPPVGS